MTPEVTARKNTNSKQKSGSASETPHHNPALVFAQRYQAFFNSTNDAIAIFNPRGDILDANPRLLKLTGFDYDVLVSKSIKDIFDKDCHSEIMIRFKRSLDGRQYKYPIESFLVSKSGQHRPTEMTLTVLKNQFGFPKTLLAVIRDVTRRWKAENRLKERASELQRVFDTVPTILVVVDERRRIQRVNRSGLEVFGKAETQVIGKRIGDVIGCKNRTDSKRGCGFGKHAMQCALNESIIRCLKEGKTLLNVEESLIVEADDGTEHCFRMNMVPLPTRDKTWCVVSLEDITDRKEAELEAMRLHDSITRANLELKKTLDDLAKSQSQLLEAQKLEQIGLLSSGLAHNLKTPLGGIKGYAQLLKMDYPDMNELDMIVNEVEIMESIINNLMLKSRKGHQKKEELLNLNDLLSIELEFLSANMFYKHRVTSSIKLDPDLPSITGVYAHFSQTIMNIIQNGLDAMYECDVREMSIQTRHDESHIYVDITDTGCGIPEEIRDKVFDVFYTSKPASTERKGNEPHGTGLGLASATYFMQQYGGKINIESTVGKGTTVTLCIPYSTLEEEDRTHARALIVDDSESMVDILTLVCQNMGIEAYGAKSGTQGLELVKKVKPDVIVTDLVMPGLTGPQMMAKVRENNPKQRVIYISGYSENPEFRDWLAKEAKSPAMTEVMRKPFPLERFKKVLKVMTSVE